ncbi:MAG: putative toxin-antitoxin system toxin component, PIN family [Thermomicrobiales bacterium]
MTIVVLDVNILASAALNEHGTPARAFDMALDTDVTLAVSKHILVKLNEVFGRPYFLAHLSSSGRDRVLRALTLEREPVEPDQSVTGIAPDTEDDLVLGTAVAANAEYLVTGDKGLLAVGEYRGVRIVTAEEFLRELERSGARQ